MLTFCVIESWLIREDRFRILTSRKVRDLGENGRHTVTYDDGGSYEGALRHGRRHGYGTYTRSDRRRHIGAWFADEEHRNGTLTGVRGNTRAGDWFTDTFTGA